MDIIDQEMEENVFAFTPRRSDPLQGTVSAANAIARVRYHHDAMIDLIIARPTISQNELAESFGYKAAWVSRIVNSDAFQARLAARKADIVDPSILATVDEKLRTLASVSLDVILDKLEKTPTLEAAKFGAELATKALGYGARAQNVAVQQNFVVAMPTKSATPADWAAAHGARTLDLQQITDGRVV